MKLTFVNVGYGEAILLECPDPDYQDGVFVMLIDGGGARSDEFACNTSGRLPLAEYLQTDGPGHIDLMVSTHAHEDHICGLVPVAEKMLPGAFWQTMSPELISHLKMVDPAQAHNLSQENFMAALNAQKQLCDMMRANGIPISSMCAGASGQLCKGLTYQVLAPSEGMTADLEQDFLLLYNQHGEAFFHTLDALDRRLNNSSLTLLLEYQGIRLLLPGDTNAAGYAAIPASALAADLFKVGHHGQKDGADEMLLQQIRPKAVVCCASSDRRYNSAHPEVLELMRRNGAELYFSDCPELPGLNIPAHRAVTFTVACNGGLSAEYIL